MLAQPGHLLVRRAHRVPVSLPTLEGVELDPHLTSVKHGIVWNGILVRCLERLQLDRCALAHGLREVRRLLIARIAQVTLPL